MWLFPWHRYPQCLGGIGGLHAGVSFPFLGTWLFVILSTGEGVEVSLDDYSELLHRSHMEGCFREELGQRGCPCIILDPTLP